MGRIGKIIDGEKLRKSYEDIGSIKKLAKMFHTSNNRMIKLLSENGIKTKEVGNKIKLSQNKIKTILEDYEIYNLTMKEICDKHDIKVDKLREIFFNNGVVAYKWHGHVKQSRLTKNKFIKKIASILDEKGIGYELNFKITTNFSVGIMSNGICIDVYNNKTLLSNQINNKRMLLSRRRTKCLENGYKYIQIFEDEYKNNFDIVLSKIKHQLGIDDIVKKIPGRKCIIEKIKKDEAEKFLNENHIQGFVGSSVHIGAKYGDMLVGVMSFLDEGSDSWNLTRFASLNGCICQGIGGKLFKYFINEYKPKLIRSFADKRWTLNADNNIYTKLGFKYEYSTVPGYYYCNQYDYRRIRRERFRKSILLKKYELSPELTELEMARQLGYDRIWDCGLFKYVWTNPENEIKVEEIIVS